MGVLRDLATVGVAVTGPLVLLLGAAVAATSVGGTPPILLSGFVLTGAGFVLSLLAFLATEIVRRPGGGPEDTP